MTGSRIFFALCLVLAVGLIGAVTGNALHPQAMTPAAAAGLDLWRTNGCEGCHTLYGIGGNYGPDLTHIYEERGEAYLREFFINPNAFHPNQRMMPRFTLTRDDISSLIALLQHAGGDNGTPDFVAVVWPPYPIHVSGTGSTASAPAAPAGDSANTALAAGKTLFGQNCASCHSLVKDIKIIGPSLWGIATRGSQRVAGLSAEQYVRESILHPSDYVVEGFQDVMAKNLGERLSATDLDNLIAFLMQYTDQ